MTLRISSQNRQINFCSSPYYVSLQFSHYHLVLKEMPLEWVCQYKYLGQLNFRGHVEYVNKKIAKMLTYCTNYYGCYLEQEKNYCLN